MGVVLWAASRPSNSRLNHCSEASVLTILPTVPILPDLLKLLDSASILGWVAPFSARIALISPFYFASPFCAFPPSNQIQLIQLSTGCLEEMP